MGKKSQYTIYYWTLIIIDYVIIPSLLKINNILNVVLCISACIVLVINTLVYFNKKRKHHLIYLFSQFVSCLCLYYYIIKDDTLMAYVLSGILLLPAILLLYL